MNRRGKRLAFTVAATGGAVLLVLAIAHWQALRDHVEAWHFQLTRETRSISHRSLDLVRQPAPGYWNAPAESVFQELADFSGLSVIFEATAIPDDRFRPSRIVAHKLVEQVFPRRAYVIIEVGLAILPCK